ncbi:MAG: NAD(P)-dependent alcohol dehydrogenase [Verrucomicrobiaceae bacterium]|nr:NAD(P)-dependent alcohol dehydrogenase [Verrucomicrobiaceae bacterium]
MGAKLMGATLIIGVDGNEHRLEMAGKMGADGTLHFRECNVVKKC